jgi:hypothetical protein
MTLAAIDDLALEARESVRESLYVRVRLAQQVQHEPQSRSAPYARQRSHLVYSLL